MLLKGEKKKGTVLSFDPAISLLGIYRKRQWLSARMLIIAWLINEGPGKKYPH